MVINPFRLSDVYEFSKFISNKIFPLNMFIWDVSITRYFLKPPHQKNNSQYFQNTLTPYLPLQLQVFIIRIKCLKNF